MSSLSSLGESVRMWAHCFLQLLAIDHLTAGSCHLIFEKVGTKTLKGDRQHQILIVHLSYLHYTIPYLFLNRRHQIQCHWRKSIMVVRITSHDNRSGQCTPTCLTLVENHSTRWQKEDDLVSIIAFHSSRKNTLPITLIILNNVVSQQVYYIVQKVELLAHFRWLMTRCAAPPTQKIRTRK